MKASRKNVSFPTENWLYLGNGERYGSLIKSDIRAIRLWKSLTLKTVTRYCG